MGMARTTRTSPWVHWTIEAASYQLSSCFRLLTEIDGADQFTQQQTADVVQCTESSR